LLGRHGEVSHSAQSILNSVVSIRGGKKGVKKHDIKKVNSLNYLLLLFDSFVNASISFGPCIEERQEEKLNYKY
jgi:hypothetical protein